MSLYFGPVFVMTGELRPMRACVRAQRKGPINLRGFWQSGCSKMTIRRQNIEIARHNDVVVQIDMLDQSNNPLDISGFQNLTWIIAESVRGEVLMTFSTDSGSLVLPSAFRAIASLTASQTGNLPARRMYHALRGVNSSGDAQTMLLGTFNVIDTRIAD